MTPINLRVFADAAGLYGNPVGIFIDESGTCDTDARIALTAETGFSECVFVESIRDATIRIYTGQQEIAFAGHAAVGAAWFLAQKTEGLRSLSAKEGTIEVDVQEDIAWATSALQTTPPWWHEYVEIDALEALNETADDVQGFVQLWSWIDETAGVLRSRTFAPAWGIPEDEANGSGCMRLAACLGRSIEVRHGAGSLIYARPAGPGLAAVGGRVIFD